ncbi:unnamed protein product [Protopolystoma xenopodis]|uniref:Arf-GAP domain-containing protein n=1 Tax=Protopolystoma xenopodis TaxID=117903 RepID=A0A3S5CQ40_9PLAT|nr:unnamed protein product [Protopolystoma xenopodis]
MIHVMLSLGNRLVNSIYEANYQQASVVRSLTLDNWEPELIHVMLSLGNRLVNSIYEANYQQASVVCRSSASKIFVSSDNLTESSLQKPCSDSTGEARKMWAQAKWGQRYWAQSSNTFFQSKSNELSHKNFYDEKTGVQTESDNSCVLYRLYLAWLEQTSNELSHTNFYDEKTGVQTESDSSCVLYRLYLAWLEQTVITCSRHRGQLLFKGDNGAGLAALTGSSGKPISIMECWPFSKAKILLG